MYSIIGVSAPPRFEVNSPVPKKPEAPQKASWYTSLARAAFRCGRDFCLDTTIHGFNHIAVPGRYWLERLVWAALTAAAIWGAVGISLGQLARYNDNPTVVTLEKDFRSWLFKMPAITSCDKNRVNPKKIEEVLKTYFNVESQDEKYEYYKSFISTVANSDLEHLESYKEFAEDDQLAMVDLRQLAVDVTPKFQIKATWSNGQDVTWSPFMTESGVCYGTNSIATIDVVIVKPNPNDTKIFPLTCKYSSQRCYVLLEISSNATFFTHSPFDVADAMGPKSMIYSSMDRSIELSVVETECGKGIRDLSPQRRRCLYTDEPQSSGEKVYSTNTCRLSCRAKLAQRLCGCRPFFYPNQAGVPRCTPKGMYCLSQHTGTLLTNGGVKCACSPQCQDAIFRDVATSEQIWGKGQFAERGSIRYTVQAPRSRYTREIVFHFQDLVVSFGGAAGLFLGASFISFVEIFYFLFVRAARTFVKDRKKDRVQVLEKPISVPFETARIHELNNVLEKQRGYDLKGF